MLVVSTFIHGLFSFSLDKNLSGGMRFRIQYSYIIYGLFIITFMSSFIGIINSIQVCDLENNCHDNPPFSLLFIPSLLHSHYDFWSLTSAFLNPPLPFTHQPLYEQTYLSKLTHCPLLTRSTKSLRFQYSKVHLLHLVSYSFINFYYVLSVFKSPRTLLFHKKVYATTYHCQVTGTIVFL